MNEGVKLSQEAKQAKSVERQTTEMVGTTFSVASNRFDGDILLELASLYASGPDSIRKALVLYGGPAALLREAARAIEQTGANNGQSHQDPTGESDIRALYQFAEKEGLILDAKGVRELLQKEPLKPGIEHQVGVLRASSRVLKDYDTFIIDPETGEMSGKPTDSLFDYLTDHQISNLLFEDRVRFEGVYLEGNRVHIVISQPFIHGRHLKKEAFHNQLIAQGLEKDPGFGRYHIAGSSAGKLSITDLHEDNAIFGSKTQFLHPIDVHYKFGSPQSRIEALRKLGLWEKQGED